MITYEYVSGNFTARRMEWQSVHSSTYILPNSHVAGDYNKLHSVYRRQCAKTNNARVCKVLVAIGLCERTHVVLYACWLTWKDARAYLCVGTSHACDKAIQRHRRFSLCASNELRLRGDVDEFTKGFRTIRDDESRRTVEQSCRVFPSSLTDDAPSFAPHRYYVTRFVTYLLRGRIPRPLWTPLSTSNKIHRPHVEGRWGGRSDHHEEFALRCAHDRCVGESIDKTLCIYGYESRRARCAIYLRLSMYVCLARYRATIISAHGRERTYLALRPTDTLIRAKVKGQCFMHEIIYRCQLNRKIIGVN